MKGTSSQTRLSQRPADVNVTSDLEVEKDVRAMDDEADKLRRLSRARTIIDPSLLASQDSRTVEITTPLPDQETPTIRRNKQMRSNAMAAISHERNQELPETSSTTPKSHRRKSSVNGRGKRVSSSFELSGIISKYFFVQCVGMLFILRSTTS